MIIFFITSSSFEEKKNKDILSNMDDTDMDQTVLKTDAAPQRLGCILTLVLYRVFNNR